MTITTRYGIHTDLNSLRELAIESFTNAYAEFNTAENMRQYLEENFSETKLLNEIEAGQILIGLRDEEIVAYAKLILPNDQKIPAHKALEISRLYTSPALIGQHIGSEMIRAILEDAVKRDRNAVCLDVWQKNYRAVNFYQRMGFRIHGLTRFQLGDDIQDDFVMLKVL